MQKSSLQSASMSNPVTFSRKMPTTGTDVTTAPPMMPAYHYPVMYNMQGQAAFAQMPMHQTGMVTMAPAAPISPVNMSVSPTGDMVAPMALHYTSSENLYQMAQAGTPIVPAPALPNTYTQQAVISVKPADQMNVFETSHWVKNLAEAQGWPEAHTYAQSFANHGVTGLMLAQLTIDDLEKYLGVEKHGHRLHLMSCIQQIYPYFNRSNSGWSTATPSVAGESTTELSELDSEFEDAPRVRPELKMVNSASRGSILVTKNLSQRNLLIHENLETIRLQRPQLCDDSSCTSITSNGSMTSNRSFSSAVSSSSICTSINGGDRRCQLTLTMEKAPECKAEAVMAIRNTLTAAGFDAHARSSERSNLKFIIRFQSESEAKRALEAKAEIGLELSEYNESRKKVRGPRPTPSNPQQYMVLHHAQVRSGKSMKSKVLGFVEKGDVFFVNQIKGKRARLIERTAKGDNNLGWVSLRNNAGYQLMAPFHE